MEDNRDKRMEGNMKKIMKRIEDEGKKRGN